MSEILRTTELEYLDMINYPEITIHKNKVNFICGDSGCGKSTFLRLLNNTLPADKGEILYQGKNILDIDSIELRKEVLLVGQSVYLFDASIRDNFINYYQYRNLPIPTDEDIKNILHICVSDFPLDMDCTQMSGGEKQRVYIAICLSLLPKVIMLDEPTSALDYNNAEQLLSQSIEFCKKKNITMIIVSHDKSLVQRFADTIIDLNRGDNSGRNS